jgi:hypothetical protein
MPTILSKPDNPHKTWINIDIAHTTIAELKCFAKQAGLKVSGNKAELITRYNIYKTQHLSAQQIQKTFRGYYTRLWISLKKGTEMHPVNDTDFYTLEPVNKIPFYAYLHYTDPNTHSSYVFNMLSINEILKKMPRFENPYTRSNMEHYNSTLLRICRLTSLLYSQRDNANTLNNTSLSILEKTRSLFIDIDLLGHYTNISWFLELDDRDLLEFYVNMQNIWASLFDETRLKIYPDGDLFSNMPENTTMQETIIDIGNKLVNSPGDRSLGIFYYLMALTTVSSDARTQYAFLYDTYETLVQ